MIRQISLRLPIELHERLKTAADRNRRSLHAEILWRLEQVEKAEQSDPPAEPHL
jgi:predicted DNA-binding protein